jgi:ElaB/YqjD/DUF883 family membrane-anchored ribosome-binding protein
MGRDEEESAMVMITSKARAARRVADDLTSEARDAIDRATDRAADTYAAAREVVDRVNPFVKDRTYLSLGLAALAGLIIGGLFLPPGPRVVYVKPRD